MPTLNVLIDEPKPYYSYLDENFFFGWLDEVDAVTEVRREGAQLNLTVADPVDDDSLRDLISLLMRYDVDMKPLAVLATESNRIWLENSEAYWYKAMFW